MSPPDISVVVPTYQGDEWLGPCLESLARQTLSYDRFEVVLVPNGPPTRVEEIVAEVQDAHPGFDVRLVWSETPGASRARNVGIEAARGRYLTYVDDDDRIGPRYLESMLRRAAPDRIVVARLTTVDDGDTSRPNLDSYMADYFDRWIGGSPTSADLAQHLHSAVAKLAPAEMARAARFDETMTYCEDMVYWTTVVTASDPLLVLGDEDPEATYLYCRRSGSLAAFDKNDWESQVLRRFDVIAALEAIDVVDDSHRAIRATLEDRQYRQAGDYLRRNPAQRDRFDAELESRHFSDVPWDRVHPPLPRVLSVVDTDTRDSQGRFAHHRVRARGERTDVIFYQSEGGESDLALSRWMQVIAGKNGVGGPAEATWAEVGGFAAWASQAMGELDPNGTRYLALYSLGPSPMDHLVTGVLKLSRPSLRWTVQHVDPMIGVVPRGAGARSVPGTLTDLLGSALASAGADPVQPGATVEAWADAVIDAFADEVVRRPEPVARNVGESEPPLASVIVATTGAEDLSQTIAALEAQTLPSSDFEVVVQARSTLEESRAAGVAAARSSHVTLLDAGDFVGSRFLEALVENVRDRSITAVPVVRVHRSSGRIDAATPSLLTARRFLGLPHSQADLAPMVAEPWGHLDPVAPPGATWIQLAEASSETAYFHVTD